MPTPLLIILLLGGLIIAFILYQPVWRKKQRRLLSQQGFPEAWHQFLSTSWPLYQKLPEMLHNRLNEQVYLFVKEKQFIGCNGFVVRDEHKVLIAAQACLLIINKPYEYFDKLKSILIYPSAFIVTHQQILENGTIAQNRNINTGEAWETGKIVLSWDDAYNGMINIRDGQNVVIHEFAHLLDHTSGAANGAPLLQHANDYKTWSQIFSSAFQRLQGAVASGTQTVFDSYGSISPGEFFAVATEIFFENSQSLQNAEPALHEQLVKFYAVDPTLW